jgi:hypothetical protein
MHWLVSSRIYASAVFLFGFACLFPSFISAADPKAGLGWEAIANTKLQGVCPAKTDQYDFSYLCQNVIRAWSGGVLDSKRNRLVLWGGGHTDYYGNELYALDLTARKMVRLTEPGPIAAPVQNPECLTTLSDATPNSRHTYSGLAYIAHLDKMFAFGGSLACAPGKGGEDTWVLDLGSLKWTRVATSGGAPVGHQLGAIADYNPNDRLVYLFDRESIFSFDFSKNQYSLLSQARISIYMNGVIDTKRDRFVLMGMDDNWSRFVVQWIDLKNPSKQGIQTVQAAGCEALMESKAPGMAYDPISDRIVVWPNFGGAVYLYDEEKKTCTERAFPGGPPDSQHAGKQRTTKGTYGRFRYSAALDAFVVVSDWDTDAYLLRLR